MSRFLLHILAAFAELERELIRERVTAGVRAAKARGKQVGRPKRTSGAMKSSAYAPKVSVGATLRNCCDVPVATLLDSHRVIDNRDLIRTPFLCCTLPRNRIN